MPRTVPGKLAEYARDWGELGVKAWSRGWWEMPGKAMPELGWPGTKNGQTHRVWLPKPAQVLLAALDGEGKGFVLAGQRGGAVDRLDQPEKQIRAPGELPVQRVLAEDLRPSRRLRSSWP